MYQGFDEWRAGFTLVSGLPTTAKRRFVLSKIPNKSSRLTFVTLILYCLTQDYVIQVSDRRLTFENGAIADDNRNKVVLYCFRMAFAYTGLAKLSGQWTDDWLADKLQAIPHDATFEAALTIAKAATVELAGRALRPSQMAMTFAGVGWELFEEPGRQSIRKPVLYRISNAQNERGEPARVSKTFTVVMRQLGPNFLFAFGIAGQPLGSQLRKHVIRSISECTKRRTGPGAMARIFVDAIRRVAESNPAVGRSLLSVVIPTNHGPSSRVMRISADGRPSLDVSSFGYLRADRTSLTHECRLEPTEHPLHERLWQPTDMDSRVSVNG